MAIRPTSIIYSPITTDKASVEMQDGGEAGVIQRLASGLFVLPIMLPQLQEAEKVVVRYSIKYHATSSIHPHYRFPVVGAREASPDYLALQVSFPSERLPSRIWRAEWVSDGKKLHALPSSQTEEYLRLQPINHRDDQSQSVSQEVERPLPGMYGFRWQW